MLESLGSVGTDVHDLVDTVQDLRQVVKGFPGSRLFRRRGAEGDRRGGGQGDRPGRGAARRLSGPPGQVSVGYPSADDVADALVGLTARESLQLRDDGVRRAVVARGLSG